MKKQKKVYEEPCIEIWYIEVSDIVSESASSVDGNDGHAGDPNGKP